MKKAQLGVGCGRNIQIVTSVIFALQEETNRLRVVKSHEASPGGVVRSGVDGGLACSAGPERHYPQNRESRDPAVSRNGTSHEFERKRESGSRGAAERDGQVD